MQTIENISPHMQRDLERQPYDGRGMIYLSVGRTYKTSG